MFVYSQAIIRFSDEVKSAIQMILSREIGLTVRGDRFSYQGTSYPIKVVLYDHKSEVGYFDPVFYELGFHEQLMHSSQEILHRVIRHELAHYLLYVQGCHPKEPHGKEFKEFCKQHGWDAEVGRASIAVNAPSDVLRKVQKLMALSSSSNVHEAELAMMKSRELLLKHNLESAPLDGEQTVLQRVLMQTKIDTKMQAIAHILSTFFVGTVYKKGDRQVCLEIFGKKANVEIGEYVANHLDHQFDLLWEAAKKQHRLKGLVARNSFFFGIARGYCEQVKALKTAESSLIRLDNQIKLAQEMIYPHLRTTKSSRQHCQQSSMLGEKTGQQLRINPAVQNNSTILSIC